MPEPSQPSGPSLHLSWVELGCHDRLRTPYPLDWRETRAVTLARGAFEVVRAVWGLPITIISGYRTVEYNAEIYRKLGQPVVDSQHCYGRALDMYPPEGVTVYDFWTAIMDLTKTTPIRGVGYASPKAGNYVHIDTREADRVAVWRY
jgi:uncharacterized protein YcbK (DUF882 family)